MNKSAIESILGKSLFEAMREAGADFDFTGRETDGTRDMGYTEFSASLNITNEESDDYDNTLVVTVLVDTDEVKKAENLDDIDWGAAMEEASYEII